MDFSYLTNVMTALQPLMTWALPVVGTGLILGRILKLYRG